MPGHWMWYKQLLKKMKEVQLIIGVIFMLISLILILSSLSSVETESAGLIMIGPVPIVFGNNDNVKKVLLIVGIIIGLLILIKFLNSWSFLKKYGNCWHNGLRVRNNTWQLVFCLVNPDAYREKNQPENNREYCNNVLSGCNNLFCNDASIKNF